MEACMTNFVKLLLAMIIFFQIEIPSLNRYDLVSRESPRHALLQLFRFLNFYFLFKFIDDIDKVKILG